MQTFFMARYKCGALVRQHDYLALQAARFHQWRHQQKAHHALIVQIPTTPAQPLGGTQLLSSHHGRHHKAVQVQRRLQAWQQQQPLSTASLHWENTTPPHDTQLVLDFDAPVTVILALCNSHSHCQ